jgi:hypothetical protein
MEVKMRKDLKKVNTIVYMACEKCGKLMPHEVWIDYAFYIKARKCCMCGYTK